MALHFDNPEDQKWYLRVKDLTPLTDNQISELAEENGGMIQAYQAGIFCPHCCVYDTDCDKDPAKKAKLKQPPRGSGKMVLAVIVGVRIPKPGESTSEVPEIDIEDILRNPKN